jgi:IclR family mhp operon transcriptional activator
MGTLVKGHIKGLHVLEVLNALKFATALEVAEHLNMPRPSAHRFLMTLVEEGFAVQIGGGSYFSPSKRVTNLCKGYDPAIEALEAAEPLTRELSKQIDWPCYLHSVGEDAMVTRVVCKSNRSLGYARQGSHLSMAHFSAGRAFLSRMERATRDTIIDRLCRKTTRKDCRLETPDAIKAIVKQSQSLGFGFRENGMVPRTGSFSVPIGEEGQTGVYLTVQVMLAVTTLARAVDQNLPKVSDTVAMIERQLEQGCRREMPPVYN